MESKAPIEVPPLEAALVIIVTFFLSAFLGAAVLLTAGTGPALVIGELLILIIPLAYMMGKGINIRSYVKFDPKPKYVLLGIAIGSAMILLNITVTGLLTSIFGTSTTVESANNLLLETSSNPLGLTLVAASLILAGICEEFAFRGFLQNSIFKNLTKRARSSKYSFAVAALISALVFGFFHFDPQAVYTLSTFIAGLVLAYIFHRWNYVTSATAHATMNIIVLALLLWGI